MTGFWNKSRSLKQLVLLSWIAPAVLTLVASLAVFFFLGWLDYQNGIDLTTGDLREKSKIAARRVSAEILLQEHGAVDSVLRKLQAELGVRELKLSDTSGCVIENEMCATFQDAHVMVARKIPQISPGQFVVLTQSMPGLSSFLNPRFLAWSTIPVFLLIVSGLVIQLVFLRRKVIDPVNSLIGAGDADFAVNDAWPIEVKQIGEDLRESFDAKEQAVFAMLAKGVIHDIKTFMHSLLIATDMISESFDETKRTRRLENLYTASKSNLPKIKRIIELTLDGSRDVPIRETNGSLTGTIKGAIAANAAYADEKSVLVSFDSPSEITAAHDPVQLERALANLIRNGIEVFSSSESASNAPREVRVSVDISDGDAIQINVEDSGPGYEGDGDKFLPTKSQKAHGAGLGLYITQKIVQGHRGKLEVIRSALLGGARFCISLPKGGLR